MNVATTAVTTCAALALLLAGCGDDQATGGAPVDNEGATQDAAEPDAGGVGGGDFAEPSGTITVDGTATEVSGLESSFRGTTGDFEFCTYNDGGDEGSVTILVRLSDTELFYVNFGRPDGIGASADYPTHTDSTSDVVGELTDDRAVGTATFDDGTVVDFDVDCAR